MADQHGIKILCLSLNLKILEEVGILYTLLIFLFSVPFYVRGNEFTNYTLY